MYHYYYFKIVTQQEISINLTLDSIRKYPTHEHYTFEAHEKIVIHKFKPTKKTDLEAYKIFLTKLLKKKYKAYSVTFLELQKQIN